MRLPVASIIAPFALCLSLFHAPLPVFAKARKVPPKPPVKIAPDAVLAPAWVLVDPATGRVLESKNPHQRMFPASTTKTMTALLAIESGKLDQTVTIGPNPPKTGEQSINLMQGEQFLLRDLVRAALIKSANDSCVAIAEAVAGDVPTFVKMMNAKAKELGAKDTHFCNPHGLHDPNHYTTAYDLALIARAAMQHPEFNEITRTRQTAIHGNWKIGALRPLLNRNRLLLRWAQCDGVKTGYTRQAGRCLIASATQLDSTTQEPWRLLSVVLHAPDSWHDAQALLQYHGFAHYKPFIAARSGEEVGETTVANGSSVKAVLPQNVVLTLRSGEQESLTREMNWDELSAPLQAGQVIGHLNYFAQGRKVAVLPVVAQNDVPASHLAGIMASGLRAASPLRGLNHLSLLQWPSTAGLMVSSLLLMGVTLLWGGLKGGRKQPNEKQQPTGRPNSGQASKSKLSQRQSASRQKGNRPTDSRQSDSRQSDFRQRDGRSNPKSADGARRAPSAGIRQPQREGQSEPQRAERDAARNEQPHNDQSRNSSRHVPHSRAARQAQQSRHSAPGSIHQQRQHKKPENHDDSEEQPCLGAQFIARFLDEENQTATLNAEIEQHRDDKFNGGRDFDPDFADNPKPRSRW